MQHLVQPPAVESFVYWIDRWSFFQNMLHIRGHAFSPHRRTTAARLVLRDGAQVPLAHFRLPSADLTMNWGRAAAACRIDERVPFPQGEQEALHARLEFTFDDGTTQVIANRDKEEIADPVHALLRQFFALVHELPPGHMLEIGSRNRTGDEWRHQVPQTWRHTGIDIVDGPNVDVVGDAHEASRLLPHAAFDAVMSFAVFEHLLMPWKAAVEVSRLLKPGAIGLIVAPHTWPLHEEPCDYFRFSRHSWKALFNASTGFEILAAADGCPAFIVAERLSGASAWSEMYRGALMSAVIFRKTGESLVDWPVSMKDIAADEYPF
ncbi:methyltransferase domain-containing protein [Xanthobacter pseudotagetidis]|uniref:methyltransferase domain-containing protein n=1 Tax=Xanthobacter pseudotagetidis TaxID=3119911 RepID=UPI0037295E7C